MDNGNASIGFIGNYRVKDSVFIELKTFLPSVSKNTLPNILLAEVGGTLRKATLKQKKGDNFYYGVYFEKPGDINKIVIMSATINARSDVQTLSFPFIELNMRQLKAIRKK